MSVSRFDLVTIDSTNTERLAAFWSLALELVELEREDGDRWIVIGETSGFRRLGFQRSERVRDTGALHLDLVCDVADFDAEVQRFIVAGATLVAPTRVEPYGSIANLTDPDGNSFDLCCYR